MQVVEKAPSLTEEFFDAPDAPDPGPGAKTDDSPKWKGKGKAVVPCTVGDGTADLDDNGDAGHWAAYEPPAALKDAADIESDVLLQVVLESIENIKARLDEAEDIQRAEEEAEKLRLEEEAEKLRLEEEARKETEKGKQVDIPEVLLDKVSNEPYRSSRSPSPNRNPDSHAMSKTIPKGVEPHDLLVVLRKPGGLKKRSLMGLFRRLNNAVERGESSTAGAARNYASSSSLNLSTYAARKRSVFNVLKKTRPNGNSSPASSVREEEIECVSCLDDFSPKEMIKAPCHSYCKDCFRRLVHAACDNEQQWPPKCCLNTIPYEAVVIEVDDELKSQYCDRAAEWNIPVGDRVYCNRPSCGIWLRPDHIDRSRNTGRCSSGHQTCIICRGPQHDGDNCPQDRELLRTNELAEEEGWKRCYGCHAFVEHREACQHMTCRCGAQFCYVCGAQWRTCGCTMEQLAVIKAGAAARRQARETKEAEEAAEIQEALRLVEEFEREETLKAELLRREQERLAEERRQKELERRIEREAERRKAVQLKYQELQKTLESLHDIQRITVQRDHDNEEADLEERGSRALEQLREEQKVARENLNASTETKITGRETGLGSEYVLRSAEETRIREGYHAKLKSFWSGRRGGEAKTEAALNDLKCKMDASFEVWRRWMEKELESYRWSVKEEQAIQEELMQETERRLAQSTREEQHAFVERKAAELRWVAVVIREREQMLAEMEVDETENGEDIEAWFAESGLDDPVADDLGSDSDSDSDSHQEFSIPGAFS